MIHQYPESVGAKYAIFINYNSGFGILPDSIVSRSTPAKILASSLLYSSVNDSTNDIDMESFTKFCLSVDSPEKAVELIRSNLGMNDSDMLVVVVDELGKLGEDVVEPRNRDHLRGGTLRSALKLMDSLNDSSAGGSVAFLFSALVDEDVIFWRGNTGRKMYSDAMLTCLSWETTTNTLQQMFKENKDALNLLRHGKITQLLSQCSGHPR